MKLECVRYVFQPPPRRPAGGRGAGEAGDASLGPGPPGWVWYACLKGLAAFARGLLAPPQYPLKTLRAGFCTTNTAETLAAY